MLHSPIQNHTLYKLISLKPEARFRMMEATVKYMIFDTKAQNLEREKIQQFILFLTNIEYTASRQGTLRNLRLASRGGTPRLTPPDSPPRISAGLSPTRLSQPGSPRRHSISVPSTRNMFEERPSMFSSMQSSHHGSMTAPFDTGAHSGRTRVDGKEFFHQVRSRLSYEQFSAFVGNVKELNAHKQTREETLRKALEIFGPENKDLYNIFEGLISRNLH